MTKKAALSKSMTEAAFDNGYWYATELRKFAVAVGIPSANRLRKDELEKALADVEKEHEGVTVKPGETSLEDVFIQFMSGSKDNMA